MEIKTNHIGSYNGNPANSIDLTIIIENATITECITSFRTDLVDKDIIVNLREIADELEGHNKAIEIKNNNGNIR
jgi:hypothetical protein